MEDEVWVKQVDQDDVVVHSSLMVSLGVSNKVKDAEYMSGAILPSKVIARDGPDQVD